MRTIRTKVYNFSELTDQAQEVAIDQYRNDGIEDVWGSERSQSFNEVKRVYDRIYNIETILSGARLYTWIVNNILSEYEIPNYISKHKDGSIKNSYYSFKYDCLKYKKSHVFSTNNFFNCCFTGVGYDMDFLDPIINFLKNPDSYTTSENLSIPDYETVTEKEMNYLYTDENIRETLENSDFEFTFEGKQF